MLLFMKKLAKDKTSLNFQTPYQNFHVRYCMITYLYFNVLKKQKFKCRRLTSWSIGSFNMGTYEPKVTSFCFLFFHENKLVFLVPVSYKTYCLYLKPERLWYDFSLHSNGITIIKTDRSDHHSAVQCRSL